MKKKLSKIEVIKELKNYKSCFGKSFKSNYHNYSVITYDLDNSYLELTSKIRSGTITPNKNESHTAWAIYWTKMFIQSIQK